MGKDEKKMGEDVTFVDIQCSTALCFRTVLLHLNIGSISYGLAILFTLSSILFCTCRCFTNICDDWLYNLKKSE